MNKLNLNECPEFDPDQPESIDDILTWGNVEVYLMDMEIRRKGEWTTDHHWNLSWEKGSIGLWNLWKPEHEKYARIGAAAFIYLYCKGIPCAVAIEFAKGLSSRILKQES